MRRPRWLLTITVVVIAAGYVLWSQFFDKAPEKCKPVMELLDFNRSQSQLISSKGAAAHRTPRSRPPTSSGPTGWPNAHRR